MKVQLTGKNVLVTGGSAGLVFLSLVEFADERERNVLESLLRRVSQFTFPGLRNRLQRCHQLRKFSRTSKHSRQVIARALVRLSKNVPFSLLI